MVLGMVSANVFAGLDNLKGRLIFHDYVFFNMGMLVGC